MNGLSQPATSTSQRKPKLVVLARRPEQLPLYDWLQDWPGDWIAVEPELDWVPDPDTDLIVTHRHYGPIEVALLQRLCREHSVPILLLMDGILEYRNTWQHPEIPPGSFLSPAYAHKIACLGPSQVRRLSSWGNAGRCEAVGLPRLDGWYALESYSKEPRAAHRWLITTARRAGFTTEQKRLIGRLLLELHEWIGSNTSESEVRIEIRWRVSSEMLEYLESETDHPSAQAIVRINELEPSLREMLEWSDALLSTPSTLMIEGMLLGKAVVSLDPHSVPEYLPTGWTIRSQSDFESTLHGLSPIDPLRMRFQHETLADAYATYGSSKERLFELIDKMIKLGREQRQTGIAADWQLPLLTASGASSIMPQLDSRSLTQIRSWWNSVNDLQDAAATMSNNSESMAVAQFAQLKKENASLQEEIRRLETELRKLEHVEHRAQTLEERVSQMAQRIEEQMTRNRDLQTRLKAANERAQTFQERLQKLRGSSEDGQA